MHLGLSPQYLASLLVVVVVVSIFLGSTHLRRLRGQFDQLTRELRGSALSRKPVYSAETTHGKEAEFIRDRLPERFPTMLVAALLLLFAAIAWWLTR